MTLPEPLTTIDDIKHIAGNLIMNNNLSDDTINAIIQNATMQVLADGFPENVATVDGYQIPIRHLACTYLACHLATMDGDGSSKGISSEKVSVIERTYIDMTDKNWFDASPWGKQYRDLYLKYADNGFMAERIILH